MTDRSYLPYSEKRDSGDQAPEAASRGGWSPQQYRERLGLNRSDSAAAEPAPGNHRPGRRSLRPDTNLQPDPCDPPAYVRQIMDEPVGTHRARQTYHLICACVEAGLTDGQILWAAQQHVPTFTKFDNPERLDREVRRCLRRARSQHPHPGQSCRTASCENAPVWQGGEGRSARAADTDEMPAGEDTPTIPADWVPRTIADTTQPVPEPGLWPRSDGKLLLYSKMTNCFFGLPESGKSFAALHAAASVLNGGGVLLVDYEDTELGAAARLAALGVDGEAVTERFRFVAPESKLTLDAARDLAADCADGGVVLMIVDSVTELMATQGLSPDVDTDVVSMHQLMRCFTRAGITVLLIDHVPKPTGGPARRGPTRYPIGSQRKLAGLDGVACSFEASGGAGHGREVLANIRVAKDRHGHVRSLQNQHGVVAVFEARDVGVPRSQVALRVPGDNDGHGTPLKALAEKVYAAIEAKPGIKTGDIAAAASVPKVEASRCTSILVSMGCVSVENDGPSKRHTVVEPFSWDDGAESEDQEAV